MKAVVDLGAGDDMLTIDGSGASFAFAGSTFKGGSGSDTLKVLNAVDVTDLASLNAYAGTGASGDFENLLLDAGAAMAATDLNTLAGFKAVGFMGTNKYTLQKVSATQELVISDAAVNLEIDSVATANNLGKIVNLRFADLQPLAAAPAKLAALVEMTATGVPLALNVSGSGLADELTLKASGDNAFDTMVLKADMGVGADKITIDLTNQTSGLEFASDSTFDGGSGNNTLALTGVMGKAFTADFTDLTLTNAHALDVSALTGTHDLTLTFSNATDLKVAGSTVGKTIMNMGDSITFSGAKALTIDTGKGADSVNIADGIYVITDASFTTSVDDLTSSADINTYLFGDGSDAYFNAATADAGTQAVVIVSDTTSLCVLHRQHN